MTIEQLEYLLAKLIAEGKANKNTEIVVDYEGFARIQSEKIDGVGYDSWRNVVTLY